MYRVLYDSYVKHRCFLPWREVKTSFVEGLQNRAWGTVKDKEFKVEFTNSYGNPGSRLEGKFTRLFNLILAKGKAYGYEKYPEGRPCIAFGVFGREHLYLVVPAFDAKYLYIRMSYKELPND